MTYKPGAAVITSEQLDAAADQASKRGMPTTMHNVTVEGFRQSIEAGITSLAHLPIDGKLVEKDLVALNESHLFIEPTLSVGYYMSYSMKGSPWYGHPEIRRLDRFREESYDSVMEESWLPELHKAQKGQHESLSKGGLKVGLLDMSAPFRFYAKLIPVGAENLRFMYNNGAKERIGCGSDATVSNCSQAAIHLELELLDFILNQDGAKWFEGANALRTASLQSAQAMGVDQEYGSICPGKIADLVVIDGDPLKDYHLIGRPVQALFMDGQVVINRCGLMLNGA
jgi:imidazolonepropionase-like amidohydrolase